jgi:hypothetical protein
VSTEKIHRIHGISRDKLVWCLEGIHRIHRTSRDKLVWCLEGILRIHRTSRDNLVWCLLRRFLCYTGLVVINLSGVYRADS